MIDTDKYEGTNWDLKGQFTHTEMADEVLLLLAEVKRLRKLEAAVVGSWMETINRGSSWHKQLRYPCVDLGYLELRDVERILHVGNGKTITHTSPEFHLKEEYEEMAKQWIKEEYGVEEE